MLPVWIMMKRTREATGAWEDPMGLKGLHGTPLWQTPDRTADT